MSVAQFLFQIIWAQILHVILEKNTQNQMIIIQEIWLFIAYCRVQNDEGEAQYAPYEPKKPTSYHAQEAYLLRNTRILFAIYSITRMFSLKFVFARLFTLLVYSNFLMFILLNSLLWQEIFVIIIEHFKVYLVPFIQFFNEFNW